ncbi:MAG: hypothetical protein C0403_10510 [Desulfobacterium sp.]|nr:hypothetical protein [Desulfobacterium sp.]
MGDKLLKYFEFAKQRGGISMQIKLAMLTQISSPKAKIAPDSPELMKLFQESLVKLVGNDPAIHRL